MTDSQKRKEAGPSGAGPAPGQGGAPSPVHTPLLGFLAVGASGILVNSLLLFLLAEEVGLHYLLAAVLATQGSTLWNFGLHQALVFRGRPARRSLVDRVGRYLLVNNGALILRAPILAVLVTGLGVHYVAANLITLVALTVLRFALADRWIWPREEANSGAPASHFYDIHSILAVESSVALPELAFFRVPALDREADIQVRLGPPQGDAILGEAVQYHDGFGSFGFRLWMVRNQGFKVWVSPLVALSPHVLYTNVVEPILRWSFVERGYALVHAACIAFNGQAALITAPTDTGKTTTILRTLQSQSWAFLSDDMTILSPDGIVRSFPKPLTISAHTLHAVPTAQLGLGERLALAIQSRLHSRGGRRFGLRLAELGLPAATINAVVQLIIPPPKFSVARLIPDLSFSSEAVLSLVVVLAKGADGQETMSPSSVLRALGENGEDAYGFPPYRSLEGFLSRDGDFDYHWAEKEIVRRGLRAASGIRLASDRYRWWKALPALFGARDFAPALTLPPAPALASEPQTPA